MLLTIIWKILHPSLPPRHTLFRTSSNTSRWGHHFSFAIPPFPSLFHHFSTLHWHSVHLLSTEKWKNIFYMYSYFSNLFSFYLMYNFMCSHYQLCKQQDILFHKFPPLRYCVTLCEASVNHMTVFPNSRTRHQPSTSSKHLLWFIRYFTDLKMLLWDRFCAELSSAVQESNVYFGLFGPSSFSLLLRIS